MNNVVYVTLTSESLCVELAKAPLRCPRKRRKSRRKRPRSVRILRCDAAAPKRLKRFEMPSNAQCCELAFASAHASQPTPT